MIDQLLTLGNNHRGQLQRFYQHRKPFICTAMYFLKEAELRKRHEYEGSSPQ